MYVFIFIYMCKYIINNNNINLTYVVAEKSCFKTYINYINVKMHFFIKTITPLIRTLQWFGSFIVKTLMKSIQ